MGEGVGESITLGHRSGMGGGEGKGDIKSLVEISKISVKNTLIQSKIYVTC